MSLSITQSIRKKVENLAPGAVFDYAKLEIAPAEIVTAAQSLSRLARQGTITRLARGKYYKPQRSKFGNTRPNESAIINALTTRDNKTIGYLTGLAVYNRLGLTSQVSNTLVIATPNPLQPKSIQGYRVKYVRGNADFLERDIPLLQLLDALRDIKTIPDSSPDDVLKILIERIRDLSKSEKKQMVSLSLSYNAGTRALLGAIMEHYFPEIATKELKQSMNKLSSFDTGVSEEMLPLKRSWSIV